METLIPEISKLLNDTVSPEQSIVVSATESLDRLSSQLPAFPLCLIAIASGGNNQGQKVAAATYLKNFTKRQIEGGSSYLEVDCEFKNRLMQALLQAEPAVLKVLVEAFRIIVVAGFVKENSWPELVHELRSIIENSDLISKGANFQWKTINALTILQTIIKPFQYYLNAKLAKEPVPPQLELIASEILVPLQSTFHYFLDKALLIQGRVDVEVERILLMICKCIYFSVRSHMPSALGPLLPSFCGDLIRILDSLNLSSTNMEDEYLLRLKAGKRSMQIFCALVTRHRKHFDKLMPNILTCAFKIVKQSPSIGSMGFLSERVVSLSFDFISHVLETGPGWRLVSPHFSSLLESAIFPTLVMNHKDILEWEEDADEYIRKNLPSDLEEISGWKEDSFTARKSAINLLGVISMSKGPPMTSNNTSSASAKRKKGDRNKGKERRTSMGELLVIPFLSKFPVPSDVAITQSSTLNNYYGVLMAYGALVDFLKDQNPEYTTSLVRSRVLPLYLLCSSQPYLVATANWVLGELASCLPQEMSADIYSSLLQALTMSDVGEISCYPVRASAAGAIAELLENDYLPPEWLLTTVVEVGDEKVACHIPAIISTVATAVSKHIPPTREPWPQVVEKGFTALATIAQTWEDSIQDGIKENESSSEWTSGWATISQTFSGLLQQAWLAPVQLMEGEESNSLPPTSCINEASALLGCIMRYITETDATSDMKMAELLVIWAELIADWHAWEEMEDLAVFDSIQDVVNLHRKFELKDFFVRRMPSPPAPPVPQRSIIEGIGAFVSEAIQAYPSATWRACSSFSCFKGIQNKPIALWKPLLLVISSGYLCFPENVERILNKDEDKGFTIWARALAHISTNSFEPGLQSQSEIKLAVLTLVKIVERLLGSISVGENSVLQECFVSLLELVIRLKEVQEEEGEGEDDDTEDADDENADDDTDDDESSEDDEREETQDEFLERYAKAAAALEDGMITEEGDVEDQVQELELGVLDEVDPQRAVHSLIERYHHVLMHGTILPPQLITKFLCAFPEYNLKAFS
ncbi:hypothetical protein MRB53_032042 [Persea americana]|uniref:Uncharacterized protein n=1 Tax=Persea americana TaxID=3435 RepID=A0ACC2KQS7_PERAE|nr:hypothetical protein MRB53_032042 [Persea americana]